MEFEYTILDFIHNNFSHPIIDELMKFFSFLGNSGWFWILLGVVLLFFKKTRKIGITVCLSLIFSLLICNITLKPLIARMRPYDLKDGIKLIIDRPNDFSFPSGHTSASFAAAVALFAHSKRYGSIALTVASFIAFSRLYLYVHFPTDVLGGMIIGTLCGILSCLAVKYAYKKLSPN